MLARLADPEASICVAAERAVMAAVDGSCRLPVAAHAVREGDAIFLRGMLADPDGSNVRRGERRAAYPEERGRSRGASAATSAPSSSTAKLRQRGAAISTRPRRPRAPRAPALGAPPRARAAPRRALAPRGALGELPARSSICSTASRPTSVRVGLTLSVSPPLAAMLADDAPPRALLRSTSRASPASRPRWSRAPRSSPAPARSCPSTSAASPRPARPGIASAATCSAPSAPTRARAASSCDQRSDARVPPGPARRVGRGARSAPSVRAQLRLGLRGFEAIAGVRPRGLWLPECGYDPRLADDLAAAGVRYTILDAHGLHPRRAPPARRRASRPCSAGAASPSSPAIPEAARDVWSRQVGYPGDPWYREFYRDVGFDLPEHLLDGELGPDGTRLMTGIKPYRITGPGPHKEPYDPEAARPAPASTRATSSQSARPSPATPRAACRNPILVAPFDAELFGHWWFEGPAFLEHTLRALDASARRRRRHLHHPRRLPGALPRAGRGRAGAFVVGRGRVRRGLGGARGSAGSGATYATPSARSATRSRAGAARRGSRAARSIRRSASCSSSSRATGRSCCGAGR